MTPNLAILRFGSGRWWDIPWPIPVFLLWIPVILLAPFVLILLGAACVATRVPFWRTMVTFWGILCSLPGIEVRVCAEGRKVLVRIL